MFSVPRGASIYLNEKEVGQTSATLEDVPAEVQHTVEVRHSGYRTERQKASPGEHIEERDMDFGNLVAESGGLEVAVTTRPFLDPQDLKVYLEGELQRGLRIEGLGEVASSKARAPAL